MRARFWILAVAMAVTLSFTTDAGAWGKFGKKKGKKSKKGAQTEWSAGRSTAYMGDECRGLLNKSKNKRKTAVKAQKLKFVGHQVMLAACARMAWGDYKKGARYEGVIKEELRPAKIHASFDDRKFDHFKAALYVYWVASSDYANDVRLIPAGPCERTLGLAAFLGLGKGYASLLDLEKVKAVVAKSNAPKEAQEIFLTLVQDSMARIDRLLGEMHPGQQEVHGEATVRVMKERQEYYVRHQAMYDKFDGLVERAMQEKMKGAPSDELVRAFQGLRTEYMKGCGKVECQRSPLYTDITRELVALHVVRDELLDAHVEDRLHSTKGGYVAGLSQAIYTEQGKAAVPYMETYIKYDKALKAGADEDTALSLVGGIEPFKYRGIHAKLQLPSLAKTVKGRVVEKEAKVSKVKKKGGLADVIFWKEKYKVSVPYDCKDTNRLARINWDGTVEYAVDCKYKKESRTRIAHPPAKGLASELANVKKGDVLVLLRSTTFKDGDEFRVIAVKREGKTIQVRTDSVEPWEEPQKGR